MNIIFGICTSNNIIISNICALNGTQTKSKTLPEIILRPDWENTCLHQHVLRKPVFQPKFLMDVRRKWIIAQRIAEHFWRKLLTKLSRKWLNRSNRWENYKSRWKGPQNEHLLLKKIKKTVQLAKTGKSYFCSQKNSAHQRGRASGILDFNFQC